jgi:hypothetical protein
MAPGMKQNTSLKSMKYFKLSLMRHTLGSGSGVSCESKANIACVYTEHGGVMRRREQLTMTTRSLLGNIIHPTWLPPMIRHYDVTSNAIQLDPDVLFDADRIHCR